LCLPQKYINDFIKRKEEICAHKSEELNKNRLIVEPDIRATTYNAAGNKRAKGVIYKVKSGDTLYSIARKHGVDVTHIKKQNNLRSNTLQIGQSLRLH